jgi:hypothetical protein
VSNEVAIKVEGLSKAYRIGLKEQQHETMLGALAAWVKSPFENFRTVRNLSSFEDIKTQGPRDPGTQGPPTTDHRPQTTYHGPGEQKSVVSGQSSVASSEPQVSALKSPPSVSPQVSAFIPQPSPSSQRPSVPESSLRRTSGFRFHPSALVNAL